VNLVVGVSVRLIVEPEFELESRSASIYPGLCGLNVSIKVRKSGKRRKQYSALNLLTVNACFLRLNSLNTVQNKNKFLKI